ncbi:MAG: hypothetical protein PWP23_1280 [Candidatus Sumerlaeota bacterium]|nr:hypothetical protein [Candidatus Sumerlaeota bacterium]
MLFVNNAGYDEAFPAQFRHAAWGDFVTFCDMIFPWFLFIMGVSLPFSAASFRKRNPEAGLGQYALKCARRAVLLVLMGVLIDCSIHKRIHVGMNVLQLIGLAFFVAAMLYETPRRVRFAVAAASLVLYWILIRFIPLPGLEAGSFDADANAIAWINNRLRPYHLAGILSVFPASALVITGTWFGDRLRDSSIKPIAQTKTLFAVGSVLAVLGLLWHFDLEMSKAVWTPSYILFAGGLGAIVLGAFHGIIDVLGFRKWAFPFVVYGMNAITAYFISIMVRVHTVQEWTTKWVGSDGVEQTVTLWKALLFFWTDLAGRFWGSWLFTSSYIAFWFLVLLWMYRRRIFWRV